MEIMQTGFPQGRPGVKLLARARSHTHTHTHTQFHSTVRHAQSLVLVIFLKPA